MDWLATRHVTCTSRTWRTPGPCCPWKSYKVFINRLWEITSTSIVMLSKKWQTFSVLRLAEMEEGKQKGQLRRKATEQEVKSCGCCRFNRFFLSQNNQIKKRSLLKSVFMSCSEIKWRLVFLRCLCHISHLLSGFVRYLSNVSDITDISKTNTFDFKHVSETSVISPP